MAGYVIDMINVGQGDAFIVATETSNGVVNCLIDAGPPSAGDVVANHIRRHYSGRLKCAVLTHIDEDHIGGFTGVLEAGIRPDVVFMNDPRDAFGQIEKRGAPITLSETRLITASVRTSDGVVSKLKDLNIPRLSAFAGRKVELSKHLTIRVLSPDRKVFPELVRRFSPRNRRQLAEHQRRASRRSCGPENDATVIVVADYQEEGLLMDRALFTGDACLDTLSAVASIPVSWVKIPHHGSWHNCDAALVAAWNRGGSLNRAALSVGKNQYGHPHADVVAWFHAIGVGMLCTQCQGTIQSQRVGARPIGRWVPLSHECGCHDLG